ncbi:Zinc finger C3H1 domain-containing protein [Lobosporangium transversale]|nr:Zinc finger C3H1 domain-containing protein [Lobosporangium transversale]
MVIENFVETAKNWIQNFLTCSSWESVVPSSLSYAQLDDVWREQQMIGDIGGTLAARLLTSKDLCILWLVFVYLIWFHELPEQLFFAYPNDYLSDPYLFMIQWPNTAELEQESELHTIVYDIFLGLTLYFVDCHARASLVAILKNFVGFLMAQGQEQDEVLELINPSSLPHSAPEISDLFCQVQMYFGRESDMKDTFMRAIQEVPTQPYLWNRYARLLPVEAKAGCLEQCSFAFFIIDNGYQTNLSRSELAICLYKKLLGLELPYSFNPPPTRVSIIFCRTNVFLWLNYLSLLALGKQDSSYSQVQSAFLSALEILPKESISIIQTEFVVHSIMKNLDRAPVIGTFDSIVASAKSHIITLRSNPYDHSLEDETRVMPFTDFSQVNKIVECVWGRISKESYGQLRNVLLDTFIRMFPENLDLYLRWAEEEAAVGNFDQCRRALVACLCRFPLSSIVWKRLIATFGGANPKEREAFIEIASVISPLAAKFSRMPTLHIMTNDQIQNAQDEESSSDMELDN